MAKVDTIRAAGGGVPYPEGETVEPTCDAFGRIVVVDAGGGGGGASEVTGPGGTALATQATLLDVLSSSQAIQTALGTPSQEATQQLVLAAVQGLGDGATLADVVTALSGDATTQAAILAELQAQGIDIDASATTLTAIETAVDGVEALLTSILAEVAPVATLPVTGSLSISANTEAALTSATWHPAAPDPASTRSWFFTVTSGTVRYGATGLDATKGLALSTGQTFGEDRGKSLTGHYVFAVGAAATVEIAVAVKAP